MNREKRQFIHEYAEHFGCASEVNIFFTIIHMMYNEHFYKVSLLEFTHKTFFCSKTTM